MEVSVEPWIEGLFKALSKHLDIVPTIFHEQMQHSKQENLAENLVTSHESNHVLKDLEKNISLDCKINYLKESSMETLKKSTAPLNGLGKAKS